MTDESTSDEAVAKELRYEFMLDTGGNLTRAMDNACERIATLEFAITTHNTSMAAYERSFVDIRKALGLSEEAEHEEVVEKAAALESELRVVKEDAQDHINRAYKAESELVETREQWDAQCTEWNTREATLRAEVTRLRDERGSLRDYADRMSEVLIQSGPQHGTDIARAYRKPQCAARKAAEEGSDG